MIGDDAISYDSTSYFVASLDLPSTGEVLLADPRKPYLAVGLSLDRSVLADLMSTMPTGHIPPAPPLRRDRSFATAPVTEEVLDAWAALLRLLEQPADAAVLGPAREREILYRLLRGPVGGTLCQMAQDDSRLGAIRRAIGWLRDHFEQRVPTRVLADVAGMSVASFHRHFRRATSMSPLQYQKALRLQAARRLLAAGFEAGAAGYKVGYESASQFSREYRRTFGLPPTQHAQRLRGSRGADAEFAGPFV